MRQSICIISEDLSPPIDEGIKSFAHSLIRTWSTEHRVLGISVQSEVDADIPHVASVKTNKLLLSYRLWAKVRQFKPDVTCYVTSASATVFSFLRSRLLKLYWRRASVVLVSFQPQKYGWISRRLLSLFSPDMVFAQNEETMRQLCFLRCPTYMLPSGVDLEKFTPASPERKVELRTKYELDPEAYTVLHVGHITEGRNIELLTEVHRRHGAQVIFVGSSLLDNDRTALTDRLRENGVRVFNEYFHNIEEFYQLSDCYFFPVFSDQDCIGTPLSVLEAMACNIPVISVRYGYLPSMFEEGQGLHFADTFDELIQSINRVKQLNGYRTREKVAAYSWQKIAANLLEQVRANEVKS